MLYNQFLHGQFLFGPRTEGAEQASSNDMFSFNGFGLQNANVITTEADYESPPDRLHQLDKIARADGAVRGQTNYGVKRFNFKGYLFYETEEEANEALVTFKKKMVEVEKFLDVIVNGERKRYIATLVNPDKMIPRTGYDISMIPFNLSFVCKTPFGSDNEYQIQTEYNYTSLINPSTVNNIGEAPARPIYIFSISAESGITELEIENETTDESIVITHAFSAGDVLSINVEDMTVQINSESVNYSGVFPFLATGNNSVVIRWTGTSITYTFDIKYKKTYL